MWRKVIDYFKSLSILNLFLCYHNSETIYFQSPRPVSVVFEPFIELIKFHYIDDLFYLGGEN